MAVVEHAVIDIGEPGHFLQYDAASVKQRTPAITHGASHAEKDAYKNVRQLELIVMLLSIITVPLIVSLLGLGIFISHQRRQHPPAAVFY